VKVLRAAIVVLASTVLALAQTGPEFEVASVRIVPPGDNSQSYMPTLQVQPGAQLRIYNRRLDEIIMLAFNVGVKQIDGPRWLIEPTTDPSAVTRYEIVAKVPADSKTEDVPLMLRKLLADRFKLKVHRESLTTQVYSLEVAKGGHKLQPPTSGKPPGCARVIVGGENIGAGAECFSVTMAQLAQQLQSLSPAYFRDGPVVDRTGLTDSFDLHLEWMLLQQLEASLSGPTMYQAVEKLGLTLQKKRESAEMLIVDQIEQKPIEN